MEIDKVRLFRYFNNEYRTTFQLNDVGDIGAVPFVTGELKQDAYLVYVRDQYGLKLIRDDPRPDVFSKWSFTVIDDKKFSWLMLKI